MKRFKIFIAMVHYYRYDAHGHYGSGHHAAEKRAKAVERAIWSIYRLFSAPKDMTIEHFRDAKQLYCYHLPADTQYQYDIELCICTTAKKEHLLSLINLPPNFCSHAEIQMPDPRFLGYGCHELLRRHRGEYDYYGYMEDDCIIHDYAFFQKLHWFEQTFGSDCVLQPHRYSLYASQTPEKRFIDPEFKTEYIRQWVDFSQNPTLESTYLGERIIFRKSRNPHAGVFFLSGTQYEKMCALPRYGEWSEEFVTSLESAATWDLMQAFHVYKVDFSQASFFEIEHAV